MRSATSRMLALDHRLDRHRHARQHVGALGRTDEIPQRHEADRTAVGLEHRRAGDAQREQVLQHLGRVVARAHAEDLVVHDLGHCDRHDSSPPA
ncbi:MAG: hypothetical protein U0168_21940 [Nannocystaceae bacterium]